jgi:hypothetical protein
MALTLVYTGEHYFVDAVAGWIYLALICMAMPRLERAWRRWRHGGDDASNERGDSGLSSSDDAVMASSIRDLPASDAPGRHQPDPQPAT